MKHAHYFKEWHGKIDLYRLAALFEIKRDPIVHAVKKLIFAGKRGAKDELKDYQEAIDSIQRCIEMIKEDQAAAKAQDWPEDDDRINNIGGNGNDGLHYEVVLPHQDDFEE